MKVSPGSSAAAVVFAVPRRAYVVQWLVLALALLLLGAQLVYEQIEDRHRIEAEVSSRLENHSLILVEELERRLKAINGVLETMRNQIPVQLSQQAGVAEAHRELATLTLALEGVRTLAFLNFSPAVPADQFELLLVGNKRLPLPEEPMGNGQTLLIVDDEPNILSALTRLFRRESFQVLTAQSPAAVFEHLAKSPVQVVLSDQRMPDMSGTEFLARVHQLYPQTIRLVLTGYTDLDTVTEAVNRGAISKFLTKPAMTLAWVACG